jgi:hypothetical protein
MQRGGGNDMRAPLVSRCGCGRGSGGSAATRWAGWARPLSRAATQASQGEQLEGADRLLAVGLRTKIGQKKERLRGRRKRV